MENRCTDSVRAGLKARPNQRKSIGPSRASVAVACALLLSGLLLTPDTAEAARPKNAKVVKNDPGGELSSRVAEIQRLAQTQQPVRIEGSFCNSACTMYLGLPNTCVSRKVSFGFHGPMSQFYGISLPPDQFEYWSRKMASFYPASIKRWYLEDARYTTIGVKSISGAQLISMGVPECRT